MSVIMCRVPRQPREALRILIIRPSVTCLEYGDHAFLIYTLRPRDPLHLYSDIVRTQSLMTPLETGHSE